MSGRQGFITNHETFVYQEAPTTASAAFGIDSQDDEKWKLIALTTDNAIPTGTCQIEVDPRVDGDITITPNGDGFLISAKDFAVMTGDVAFIPLASTADTGILKIDNTGYLDTLDDSNTDGQILISANGSAPAWASITAGSNISVTPGANSIEIACTYSAIGTLNGDSGSATGTTVTIAGGTNITTSGAAATLTVNLDSALSSIDSITTTTGGSVRTGTTLADTLLLEAYNTNTTSYVTFATLTAGNPPTMDLASGVTIGTEYIYRTSGTDVDVSDGGTGASTLTQNGVLYGNGTSAVGATVEGGTGTILIGTTGSAPSWLAAGTDGKVLTAHTSAAPTWETPSGGWTVETGDIGAAVNHGYICNKAGTLVVTLPASAAVGDTIRVTGINTATGWQIAQNAGQTVYFGSSATTTGVGGYLQSTAIRDSVELICVVADTDFNVISSVGNITVI